MVSLLSIFSQYIIVFTITVYQLYISQYISKRCRFIPTCSSYAITAVSRFGIIKGILLTVIRIFKCHPLHPGGYDYVPMKNKSIREH